ncbi:hypothetical protein Slin15195_G106750 [Septoria linicola]|uniref:Uncharacterized protein n=1 Tax=Septoria linicola TaxID=215465 RepID=A0A9Q9B6R5_9PEZI|nr:hypothetical protein Slin14017_G069720 [Septoria linicola]USW57356.1 hypothetical protein Slin15195_G106750 [Septoria linicola]
MKTTAIIASIAAVATANSCVRNSNGLYTYTVITDNTVPDISGVCGGLWDNLKQFSQCSASASFCGANGANNVLKRQFSVPNICNAGMVEASWWDATKNKYGGISC